MIDFIETCNNHTDEAIRVSNINIRWIYLSFVLFRRVRVRAYFYFLLNML